MIEFYLKAPRFIIITVKSYASECPATISLDLERADCNSTQ